MREFTKRTIEISELRPMSKRGKMNCPTPPDLKESFVKFGIVNPLIVIAIFDPTTGKSYYDVFVGNQRLVAAKEMNIKELECIIVSSSDEIAEARKLYKKI